MKKIVLDKREIFKLFNMFPPNLDFKQKRLLAYATYNYFQNLLDEARAESNQGKNRLNGGDNKWRNNLKIIGDSVPTIKVLKSQKRAVLFPNGFEKYNLTLISLATKQKIINTNIETPLSTLKEEIKPKLQEHSVRRALADYALIYKNILVANLMVPTYDAKKKYIEHVESEVTYNSKRLQEFLFKICNLLEIDANEDKIKNLDRPEIEKSNEK